MSENMTRDDVMRETVKHVRRVGNLLIDATHQLQRRAVNHDDSKFSADEFESFARETPGLRALTYGSPEYKAALDRMRPALELHYARNRHHPEYFTYDDASGRFCTEMLADGQAVGSMNLLDLIEMLADWKAATERHADGDLRRSIEQNAARFGYGEEIKRLLLNTAYSMGWLATSST